MSETQAGALKQAADRALFGGDIRGAADLLQRAAALAKTRLDLWLALAGCRRALGQIDDSFAAVEFALQVDPLCLPALLMKGSLLETLGAGESAAAIYGAALALHPSAASLDAPTRGALARAREAHGQQALSATKALIGAGRAGEAIDRLAPFVADPAASPHVLTAQGLALSALGRTDEAEEAHARASPVDELGVAVAHADTHRFAESEAASRRALAKGQDGPETWLVRGRALQGLGDHDEAEAAYRQAIARRPAFADAHAALSQLIWMRTENQSAAVSSLDEVLQARPGNPLLSLAKARLLEYTGDVDGGYAVIADALARHGADPRLDIAASGLVMARDPHKALAHAERAFAAAPETGPAATALCQAYLALGRPEFVEPLAEKLRLGWPRDQFPIALLGVAWRMLGDPRHKALCDYQRLVRAVTLDTPPGWTSLAGYLADLAGALKALHRLRAHPIGQSVRGGAQTGQALTRSDDPVIKAFFSAIDRPLRDYIDHVRQTPDEVGRRATEAYRFAGVWSAKLRPGGYHANHLHALGWISSACHIELPTAIERGREGWLKFGEPGLTTNPPLPPEHFVKPRAGDMVLFPSYMWHGTAPFEGETPRLAVAFDALPD